MKLGLTLGIASAIALGGCGDNIQTQTITGKVAQPTFGTAVDRVSVLRSGTVVSEAPVAADGSFKVVVPAGSKNHMQFSSSAQRIGLIAPRATGTFDLTFDVRGAGTAFDLGNVRYVAQPMTHTYHYGTSGDGDGETNDDQCEDGVDPTGAVCVDDNEGQQGQSCDSGDGDGETADGATDQSDGDGETNDDGGETDTMEAAAIADRNIPAQLGCDDQSDGEQNDDGEGSD